MQSISASQRTSGDVGLAETVVGPSNVDQVEIFQPLLSEPNMYLDFSRIGEISWKLRQEGKTGIPAKEIKLVEELVEKYGTLDLAGIERDDSFLSSFMSSFTGVELPTVWDTIDEARSVSLLLLAHQYALTGSPDLKSRYASRRKLYIDMTAELIDTLFKSEHGKTPGEIDPKFERKPVSIEDLGINRQSATAAITATVNRHLMTENVRSTISSRFLQTSNKSTAASVEPGWTKEFQTNSLRGALWIQVSDHIVSGANWRECANESCTKVLFRVDRPASTKKYCTDECRDQVNNQKYYNKRSGISRVK